MATTQRQYPGQPIKGANANATGLSGATTGAKLTYTCPTGRQAKVVGAWIFVTAGAATIGFRAALSGGNVNFQSGTVSISLTNPVTLDETQTFTLLVSVLDAASTFEGCIAVEEYLAQ